MRNARKINTGFKAAAIMPPLPATEVEEWLANQPQIQQAIRVMYERSGAIIWDDERKTWHGKDWFPGLRVVVKARSKGWTWASTNGVDSQRPTTETRGTIIGEKIRQAHQRLKPA